MWRRVTVRNFRSLEDVTVDLAPFTLVVGPNGSGKSSFADVLVFAAELAGDAAAAVQRRGGIAGLRRWSPSKPFDVSVEIRVARTRGELGQPEARYAFTLHSGKSGAWSFSKEEVDGSVSVDRGTLVLTDPSGASRPIPLASDRSLLGVVRVTGANPLWQVRRIRPNPDLMRVPRIADDRKVLVETAENITVAFRHLSEKARERVMRTMERIVPGLTDIRVESFDRFLVLRFVQEQHGGRSAEFSATEMSDGALRALGLLTALAQMTRDQLLVIEEPEVSVHPGAARLLFDALKAGSQIGSVLVTTHSADLLDAASDEEILVCRYDAGRTRIGRLAEAQRAVVREGLFSLAELVRSEPLRIEGDLPPVVEG